MNFLQRLILGKKFLSRINGYQQRNIFQIVGGQLISPADNKRAYLDDGYLTNDIIYSIVQIIADKARLPEWNQYKVVDESSLKQYQAIMRKKDMTSDDFKKALDLKTKALELTEGDARLAQLLKRPNEQESFQEFFTSGTIYKLITGDRFIWAEMLDKGADGGKPMYLWNLPSQHITIVASTDFPARPLGYKLFTWNQDFTKEQVLHEKYFNPEWDINGQQLYGLSPLKAALKRYTRNNSSMDAATATFQNRGIDGIITPDISPELVNESNVAVMGEQASKIKKLLTSPEYSGTDARGKIAAAAYRMSYTRLAMSSEELQIIENEKWDGVMLCNIFGVPPELLGLTHKTYNNVKEAEKALTSRSALPLLVSFRDGFNNKLQTDWGYKGKNIYVDFDQTCYTELEENTKDKVDWVTKLGPLGVSPNRQLELLGLETVDNPLYDEPWRDPNGAQPLSELEMNEIDNELNNDLAGNQ